MFEAASQLRCVSRISRYSCYTHCVMTGAESIRRMSVTARSRTTKEHELSEALDAAAGQRERQR